ncbi:LANO_0G00980g1_1 [Lachancea nothofagi CBS 11611]|uniref:LANO_0G00980g1_1 n=1 Tax=Lachancea nothofagi CBS 11611 TaxID=1266666 RepID=A0A1G4KEQ0_9SACH|nr:LANO_0G00980g1_1 [Lachancea nothofagi CBS 11611]
MFRIAKSIVKTFEQSVSDTIGAGGRLDSYFESIPPQLLVPGNDSNESLHGLRILSCDETQLQLQSFFDYIVGIEDQPLPLAQNQHGYLYPDFSSITRILNSASGSSIRLNVWSGRGGLYRTEYMHIERKQNVEDVPLDTVAGQEYHEFDRLGFAVQWTPLVAATYTYHVLEVSDPVGSASHAGLVPREDYVIGCQDGLLATGGETLLQEILRSKANQDLVLYVYNSVSDCIRPVTVHVDGNGRLGCNMGYGYLHRIPAPTAQNSIYSAQQLEGNNSYSTTEAADFNEHAPAGSSFVPAGSPAAISTNTEAAPTMTTTSQFIVPPPIHKRKSKHHNSAAAASIQDYFHEGKDPSPASSSKNLSTPPPPPLKSQKASED